MLEFHTLGSHLPAHDPLTDKSYQVREYIDKNKRSSSRILGRAQFSEKKVIFKLEEGQKTLSMKQDDSNGASVSAKHRLLMWIQIKHHEKCLTQEGRHLIASRLKKVKPQSYHTEEADYL